MDQALWGIAGLFHREPPTDFTLREIRREESDCRWIVIVRYGRVRRVIKIASNGFTDEARVNGWVRIISAYKRLGCYSPALCRGLSGEYAYRASFRGRSCVIWEEEYAPYPLRDELDPQIYQGADGRFTYHDEIFAFLGKVAQQHFSFFPYPSGWSRFTPFDPSDSCDEVTECVHAFDRLLRTGAPKHIAHWERILALFQDNRAKLLPLYDRLPTSVFQGDPFTSNLLLDEQGHWKGLIDYNLAGQDTSLNIFLSTVLFGYAYQAHGEEAPSELPGFGSAARAEVYRILLDTLKKLRPYYTFHEEEAEAAPLLYKYITCIEYRQLGALEKYLGDDGRIARLLCHMEEELLADYPGFRAAMLG